MKNLRKYKDWILIIITLSSLSLAAYTSFYKPKPDSLPRYLAMLDVSPDDYEIVHESHDVQILYFRQDASYAVVYQKEHLMGIFMSISYNIETFDRLGNSISMPVSNKLHRNMRMIYNNKDPYCTLIDYDSDGHS